MEIAIYMVYCNIYIYINMIYIHIWYSICIY
jgi:hypothetical protein